MSLLKSVLCWFVLLLLASSLSYVQTRKKRRNKFPMPSLWMRYAKGVISREGCSDKRDDCQEYAAPAYCNTHRMFMLKNCRASCGFCDLIDAVSDHSTPKPTTIAPTASPTKVAPTTVARRYADDCEDVLDDCKRLITNPKYCLSNLAFMNNYCRKTCQLCPTTAPPVCQNQLPDCDSFIRSPAQCDLNIRGFYWKYCAKACNLCTQSTHSLTNSVRTTKEVTQQSPPTTRTSPTTTLRTSPRTRELTNTHSITNAVRTIKAVTQQSPPTTTTTRKFPTTRLGASTRTREPTYECKDLIQSCASMVGNDKNGYCKYQKEFMQNYCAKTCQFCGRSAAGHREKDENRGKKQPVEQAICEDRRPKKCKFYSSFPKYCERNKKFMWSHCRKSCKLCNTTDPSKQKPLVHPKTFTFSITKQWNGVPIDHKPITLSLSATPDRRGVKLHVRGPFFNESGFPPCPSGQACWALWNYEVAEVFFLGEGQKYLEVEVSPHGQHLILLLNGVRKSFKNMLRMSYTAKIDELNKRWFGTAVIPMEYFPPGIADGKMNAYAIHGSPDHRAYDSLYPAPRNSSTPDFHRLEFFRPFDFKAMFPSSWTQPESKYWKGIK